MIVSRPSTEDQMDNAINLPTTTKAITSPDKTVASTPPNSPGGLAVNTTNNDFDVDLFANDGTIGSPQSNNGAHTTTAPTNPVVTRAGGERATHNSNTGSSKNKKSKMLRVDKILCRVPSHESNISDLSASLSPNHPRGPPGVSSPTVPRRRGCNNGGNGDYDSSMNRADENIMVSLLHECGVFEPVSDLLTVVGVDAASTLGNSNPNNLGGASSSVATSANSQGPTPAASMNRNNDTNKKVMLENGRVVVANDNNVNNKKKKKSNGSYEKPAVWGVAPAPDESEDGASPNSSPARTDAGRHGGTSGYNGVLCTDDEHDVEYDNVELVLDESTLVHSSSAQQQGKSKASSKNKKKSSFRPPSLPTGRKSPAVGILRNKLGKGSSSTKKNSIFYNSSSTSEGGVSMSFNSKQRAATPPNAPLVVESKSDPRISHMYDMTHFDNDDLRPGYNSNGSGAGGGTPTSTSTSRGGTPVSFGSHSRGGTPVSMNSMGVISGEKVYVPPTIVEEEEEQQQPEAPPPKSSEKKKGKGLLKGLSFKSSGKSVKSPKQSDKKKVKDEEITPPIAEITPASLSSGNTTPKSTTPAPNLTPQDIAHAKKWKAKLDKSSGKYYYYHRETKEVKWEMPLGFAEVQAVAGSAAAGKETKEVGTKDEKVVEPVAAVVQEKENEAIGKQQADGGKDGGGKKKNKRGLSLRLKSKSAVNNNNKTEVTKSETTTKTAATTEAKGTTTTTTLEENPESKYWRATLDATTNKLYYYNKKTKEVSWEKPPGFQSKDSLPAPAPGSGENDEVEETMAMKSVAEKRKKSTWFNKKKGGGGGDKGGEKNNNMASSEGVENKAMAEEANTDEFAKYWRATSDASTGKTYYFNKKTKMVTWTKPEGFVEKERRTESAAAATNEDAKAGEIARQESGLRASPMNESAGADDGSDIDGFSNPDTPGDTGDSKPATIREDAPFDEPDAPFDEPFDEPKSPSSANPSPKRAHFKPQAASYDDEDNAEQEDSFDESHSDKMIPGSEPMYGRVKSLKSIDFNRRTQTFASQMTDTTRKAANTGNKAMGKSDADTLGSHSLTNNSSIVSEIFAYKENGGGANARDDNAEQRKTDSYGRALKQPAKSSGNSADNDLPRLPATPPRTRSHKGNNNRRYNGKRAENLGDSSLEEESFEETDRNEQDWDDDEVSALSGIGNESIESRKKRKKKRGDAKNSKNVSIFILCLCFVALL